jgi:integrase
MPKKSRLQPVYDSKRDRWRLDVPKTLSDTGARFRTWFKTRDAAREYIDKTTGAVPSSSIPPSLAQEADKARSILDPYDLDLVQAAREVVAALKELDGAGSILEAAKAYRASHDARTASKPLGEAVLLYLESLESLRDATIKSYAYTIQKTLAPLHQKMMADIATEDIEDILGSRGPVARKMHHRNLKAFWKWACHEKRGWADMKVVNGLEKVRHSKDEDIQILKPAEVKALLTAAEAEGTAAAAAYAIAVFGGLRMAELSKLKWSDIGDDMIEIGPSVAKTHNRRLVPICPTLRAWIDATRGDANGDKLIVPSNWTDVSKSVRRRAGWDVAARLLEDPPKPTRGAWPSNAPRHTCATVQVAIGTALTDLVFKFGHTGSHDLLRKHYVGRLTKKDALSILAIGPNGTKVSAIAAA